MSNIIKYFCVLVIAICITLAGCEMLDKIEPTDSGLVLRVEGILFPEDGYVIPGTAPYSITVTMENTRSTATGELSISIGESSGSGWQHFSVSPAVLDPIAVNGNATFTVTVNNTNAIALNNAQIRIDDPGFRKTAHVYYSSKPSLNREDFYGNWANTAGNNGAEIRRNSFRYYNNSSGVNINITSRILDWTEETYIIESFTPLSGITQAETVRVAYKLTCQITYITSYAGANFDMRAVFGLVTENPVVGHKFNVWVFQRNDGIHLGIRRDNQNRVPWVVFTPVN